MNDGYKKFIMMLGGTFLLILGVTLVLSWWDEVVIFFRAIIGMALAIAGLLMLYFLSVKK